MTDAGATAGAGAEASTTGASTAAGGSTTGAPEIARLAREHNDANVLVLPARFLDAQAGLDILKAWLETPFEGGRHSRRVAKIEPESA